MFYDPFCDTAFYRSEWAKNAAVWRVKKEVLPVAKHLYFILKTATTA